MLPGRSKSIRDQFQGTISGVGARETTAFWGLILILPHGVHTVPSFFTQVLSNVLSGEVKMQGKQSKGRSLHLQVILKTLQGSRGLGGIPWSQCQEHRDAYIMRLCVTCPGPKYLCKKFLLLKVIYGNLF